MFCSLRKYDIHFSLFTLWISVWCHNPLSIVRNFRIILLHAFIFFTLPLCVFIPLSVVVVLILLLPFFVVIAFAMHSLYRWLAISPFSSFAARSHILPCAQIYLILLPRSIVLSRLALWFFLFRSISSNIIYIIWCGIYAYANNVYFIAFNITFLGIIE